LGRGETPQAGAGLERVLGLLAITHFGDLWSVVDKTGGG